MGRLGSRAHISVPRAHVRHSSRPLNTATKTTRVLVFLELLEGKDRQQCNKCGLRTKKQYKEGGEKGRRRQF